VVERDPVQDVAASTPNVARMYDYYLGGKDNFAADRAAAEQVLAIAPASSALAKANRAFLGRAIRLLSAAGIRQFIDGRTLVLEPACYRTVTCRRGVARLV
jgi:hypothetical protein